MSKALFDFTYDQKRELYTDVCMNWDRLSISEFSKKWDVKAHVIAGIVTRLRKKGINLSKKTKDGILTPEFVDFLKTKKNTQPS
jgi:hypothetical protein